ncbi:hypothetical protein PV721_12885 [Streptomyces sp. MB09-01]|uniref:hypothetical protein n=1 Tax=Streptomyces sp. MB09-01 TaxID=3028666 RepID=UPI0029A957DA|nr:hypothetical protein [Streptomyces sp. MB09-01]MDX3535256.1 hypothetical protein [Streptomyces sp. MB09-01]
MRRTKTAMSAMALCAAGVLLTGCGSDAPKPAADSGKPAAASPAPASSAPPAKAGGATHEVTLEVGGTGKTAVMYSGIGSGFEQQTLPWSKSGTAELTAAERKVGYLVNVVPGTITGADGKLQQAPCTIKIDGKLVAESDGVQNTKGCSYIIKE